MARWRARPGPLGGGRHRRRRSPPAPVTRRTPAVRANSFGVAAASAFGLLAPLGDGPWDILSWICPSIPLVIVVIAGAWRAAGRYGVACYRMSEPSEQLQRRPELHRAINAPPPSSLGRRVNDELKLEELVVYYPGARVIHRSSSFGGIHVPVGVFSEMPYRADLYVEIPLHGPADRWWDDYSTYVPDVRVWAFWRDGFRIRSFHQYPDLGICAYMRKEWIWGCHPLQDLLDWSMCWVAKALHLHLFDHWPGRHHCSANVRFEHTSPDGFCGCGSARTYRECHMWEDAAAPPISRLAEEHHAAAAYLREMRRRGLPPSPTWVPLSVRQIDSMRPCAEGAAI